MLNILTGLPKDRKKDFSVCAGFSQKTGQKIICGSSTMKMYCRELNINPKITLVNEDQFLSQAVYNIEGVDFSCEGVITLNECCKILIGLRSQNRQAFKLAGFLSQNRSIKFIVGTADNGDNETYRKNNILCRKEIIKKISDFLSVQHQISVEYV